MCHSENEAISSRTNQEKFENYGCHLLSVVMFISDAKFEEHSFNIFRDILYSVFYDSGTNLMTSSLS